MTQIPRVSVLITAFQHAQYLPSAIEGVLTQSGDVSFELLVGDDGSDDGSRDIVARYAAAHPAIVRPFLPTSNMGGGGKVLFDELVKRSRGAYIAFLDGDDYWTSPAKLAHQARYLDEHPECAMCFHNVLVQIMDGPRADAPFNSAEQQPKVTVRELLDANVVASCSPVYRRQTLDPLPDWYFEMPWGDWPLHFMAARHGEIHYLPDLMGVYRIHEKGMYSGLQRLQTLEALTVLIERLEGIVPAQDEAYRRERLARAWAERASCHVEQDDSRSARLCLEQSFCVRRFDLRRLRPGTGEKLRLALWLKLRRLPK